MQLNFHYVRIPNEAIFDSLTLSIINGDNKTQIITVRYLEMLECGEFLELKLSSAIQLKNSLKSQTLGFDMKILNLQSDSINYELLILACMRKQIIVECEYCTIWLGYSIEKLVTTPQIDKNIEQFTRYLRSQNRYQFDSPKHEILQLRETNKKLERDVEDIKREFIRYHQGVDKKIQEIQERSNQILLKSLRHQRNELQCRGNWERERQIMLLKVDGMKKLLDQVHSL